MKYCFIYFSFVKKIVKSGHADSAFLPVILPLIYPQRLLKDLFTVV